MFNVRAIYSVLILLALLCATPVFGDQDAKGTQSAEKTIEIDQDASAAQDGKKPKKQKDPNRGRILPIPVFITEPAVGDGLGLVIAYFHRKKERPESATFASPGSIGELSREQAPPPTVTGIFGAYTNNETKAGGIGHMNSFVKNVGLSGKLAWDSRNNTSMPGSGQLIDLSLWRYDEALSGDYDYWNAKLKLLSFHQLHEKFVLGARFEYSFVDGRVPFFGVPWVDAIKFLTPKTSGLASILPRGLRTTPGTSRSARPGKGYS